jgi:FkbM family methyltransferase
MNHYSHSQAWHSQNNEEEVILNFFGDTPSTADSRMTFLEIGAFDPIELSNTRALVERGWGGVYVEPAPENAARFLKEYRDNPAIELVNSAIGLKSEVLQFFDSGGDALSTSSISHVNKWSSAVKFRPYWTKSMTVWELFNLVGYAFNFINLDVEGLNIDLFRAIPFADLNNLKLICVEHDGHIDEMLSIVRAYGFSSIAQNGENLIVGR